MGKKTLIKKEEFVSEMRVYGILWFCFWRKRLQKILHTKVLFIWPSIWLIRGVQTSLGFVNKERFNAGSKPDEFRFATQSRGVSLYLTSREKLLKFPHRALISIFTRFGGAAEDARRRKQRQAKPIEMHGNRCWLQHHRLRSGSSRFEWWFCKSQSVDYLQ